MSGAFSQHVSTLERTRQRMSTKLAELRMQRKAHAKRDREKQQRRKRAEEEQAATALVLLALTMPATNCLRSFLERSGKDELSASDTDTAVAATVDQLLAMTTAQTVRLREPRRAVEAARLRAAQAFSIEHGVHVWVAEKTPRAVLHRLSQACWSAVTSWLLRVDMQQGLACSAASGAITSGWRDGGGSGGCRRRGPTRGTSWRRQSRERRRPTDSEID